MATFLSSPAEMIALNCIRKEKACKTLKVINWERSGNSGFFRVEKESSVLESEELGGDTLPAELRGTDWLPAQPPDCPVLSLAS